MKFAEHKNIFLQIGDWVCEKILLEEWPAEEKLPSVRELAGEMEVNRNTVMRAYAMLEEEGILDNKRGIGFFVSPAAKSRIQEKKKADFYRDELPPFLRQVRLLGLKGSDLTELLHVIQENEDK